MPHQVYDVRAMAAAAEAQALEMKWSHDSGEGEAGGRWKAHGDAPGPALLPWKIHAMPATLTITRLLSVFLSEFCLVTLPVPMQP